MKIKWIKQQSSLLTFLLAFLLVYVSDFYLPYYENNAFTDETMNKMLHKK